MDEEMIKSGDGESATVVKCASWRFLPSYVEALDADIIIPEASGVLITTGNLRDITKEVRASCPPVSSIVLALVRMTCEYTLES